MRRTSRGVRSVMPLAHRPAYSGETISLSPSCPPRIQLWVRNLLSKWERAAWLRARLTRNRRDEPKVGSASRREARGHLRTEDLPSHALTCTARRATRAVGRARCEDSAVVGWTPLRGDGSQACVCKRCVVLTAADLGRDGEARGDSAGFGSAACSHKVGTHARDCCLVRRHSQVLLLWISSCFPSSAQTRGKRASQAKAEGYRCRASDSCEKRSSRKCAESESCDLTHRCVGAQV